jgi:glutamine synthetase type III
MIKTVFITIIFTYIVIVVGTNNVYAQSDKSRERHENTTLVANLTDKMKYLCIKIDASGSIHQIQDKEQQAQCKKFLDRVSIFEMRELIDKYQGIEGN